MTERAEALIYDGHGAAEPMSPESILMALVADEHQVDERAYRRCLYEALAVSGNTEAVESNAVSFAQLLFRLLAGCQKVYSPENRRGADVPPDVREQLVTILGNIALVGKSAHDAQSSYVDIVEFLSGLRALAMKGGDSQPVVSGVADNAENLLVVLDEIDIVFDMRQADGSRMFPIQKVLANAVDGILGSGKRIGTREVQLLRLAVRLFGDTDEEESAVLDKLKHDCNLAFVSFLRPGCQVIDTPRCDSFRENGSMVFWDPDGGRVLVRHERADYFAARGVYDALTDDDLCIESELDRAGAVIGHYVEFSLHDKACAPHGVADLVKDEHGVRRLLELVFDIGARNIQMDGALVRGRDGALYPINPWCAADRAIVKTNAGEGPVSSWRSDVVEAFGEYRLLPAAYVESRPLNRVTLGLCMQLLLVRNVGVASLGLDALVPDAWYQEQVLRNWVSCHGGDGERFVSHDDLLRILELWAGQLEHCLDAESFEKSEFKILDFLPLEHDEASLYELLAEDCESDERLFFGIVERADDGALSVSASRGRTHASSGGGAGAGIPTDIPSRSLNGFDDLLPDARQGDELYFLFSHCRNGGRVVSPRLGKMFAEVERIQRGPCTMAFAVGNTVNSAHWDVARKAMLLFEDELACAVTGLSLLDVVREPMLAVRLLHNLIWSRMTPSLVQDYFGLIERHELLDFAGIAGDEYFHCLDKGVLYVPKDRLESDAVLRSLLETTVRRRDRREAKSVFSNELDLRECADGVERYFIPGEDEPISQVLLLADNIMSGTSTRDTVAAYLGDEELGKRLEEKIMKYRNRDTGATVDLRDALERNGASIEVHAYYASEPGKKKVDAYLEGLGVDFKPTTNSALLTMRCDSAIALANGIWYEREDPGARKPMPSFPARPEHYAAIRKHSLVKATVFPDAMVNYPGRFICTFVKKQEKGNMP